MLTDFSNISQFYGPILEIGKVIYIIDADSEDNVFVDVNYENVDPKLLEGNEIIQ